MVGLIDCDNFFCSCERVFRPDLARKPIVVLSNNDGCVVARSKEVKAMGINDCMPYYQLLEQYPNAGIVAFSSNYTLYGDMSARIMSVLRESVPEVVQYSIDEAFLNLRGMDHLDLKGWGGALPQGAEMHGNACKPWHSAYEDARQDGQQVRQEISGLQQMLRHRH